MVYSDHNSAMRKDTAGRESVLCSISECEHGQFADLDRVLHTIGIGSKERLMMEPVDPEILSSIQRNTYGLTLERLRGWVLRDLRETTDYTL